MHDYLRMATKRRAKLPSCGMRRTHPLDGTNELQNWSALPLPGAICSDVPVDRDGLRKLGNLRAKVHAGVPLVADNAPRVRREEVTSDHDHLLNSGGNRRALCPRG